MSFFGDLFNHEDAERYHSQLYSSEYPPAHHHRASWTHEAIAGAAGFEAMRAYEQHLRATGQEPRHALMKELLAGFAAAEVDKLIETKGLDYLDGEKARRHAVAQAHHLAEQRYGMGNDGSAWVRAQGGYASAPVGYGSPVGYSAPVGYAPPQGQYYAQAQDPQASYAPAQYGPQPGYNQTAAPIAVPEYPFYGAPAPSDCGGYAGSGYGAAMGGPEGTPHHHHHHHRHYDD